MTDRPVRLRLSRAKGFNLDAASRAINGRPAVNVARPGPWGNPFDWKSDYACWAALPFGEKANAEGRRATVVKMHRAWITRTPATCAKADDVADIEFRPSGKTVSVGQLAIAAGVDFAQMYMAEAFPSGLPKAPALADLRTALAGKNLACWCASGGPCHADTLLELANIDSPEAKAAE